jgi:hypothetical protein
MSESPGFIRRHPKISASIAAGIFAVGFGMFGHNGDKPEGSGDHGGNHAAPTPTNRDPKGALACQLVLTHEGSDKADPYKLQTFLTSGALPRNARLTYQLKYQGGLSQGFNSFREDPVAVGLQAPVNVAGEAFPPDGGDALPLSSVSGNINGTPCAPAIAER